MGIHEKLMAVQQNLNAPKSQYNDFGKYNYRSCEDVLAAVKPLLKDNGLILTLSDRMIEVGGRIYVEATASLSCADKVTGNPPETIVTTAYAREEETKKGMDASQVTGAASSYARKYALNGLFCIDDNKDSDATNTGETKRNEQAALAPTADFQPRCANCGKDITPREHDYAVRIYKRPLCRDCQKNASANR